MSAITTRVFLGLSLILAAVAAWFALSAIRSGDSQAWAALAAALAVVTSVISAWGAQRVVELEEDKRKPHPYPQFDVRSRYGLLLLRVTNLGGGVAHNIRLRWDKPLRNHKGQQIQFSPEREAAELAILLPGQSIAKLVDGHVEFFQIKDEHIYRGSIHFEDGAGKEHEHRFLLDAEALKETPSYDEEAPRTHYELQKLPDHLEALGKELRKISDALQRK